MGKKGKSSATREAMEHIKEKLKDVENQEIEEYIFN